jgi:hypothetical protein
LAFKRIDGGNHKLDAGLAFELGKLVFECHTCRGLDNVCLIDDPARQSGKIQGKTCPNREEQRA